MTEGRLEMADHRCSQCGRECIDDAGDPCIRCGQYLEDHIDPAGGAWCILNTDGGAFFETEDERSSALVVAP